MSGQPEIAPLVVIDTDATPEETAALVAVFAAMAATRSPAPPSTRRVRSAWADPARGVRAPVHPGPGAWRASGLPG